MQTACVCGKLCEVLTIAVRFNSVYIVRFCCWSLAEFIYSRCKFTRKHRQHAYCGQFWRYFWKFHTPPKFISTFHRRSTIFATFSRRPMCPRRRRSYRNINSVICPGFLQLLKTVKNESSIIPVCPSRAKKKKKERKFYTQLFHASPKLTRTTEYACHKGCNQMSHSWIASRWISSKIFYFHGSRAGCGDICGSFPSARLSSTSGSLYQSAR